MTTVNDIVSRMEQLAPRSRAMDWDNCGLQCGDRAKEVRTVLIALDPFEDVADEAIALGADMIITHHPLLFRPTTTVTTDTVIGRIILKLASHNIAALNAHTNLDIAPNGVNTVLAETLQLRDVEVIEPVDHDASGTWGLLHCGSVDEQPLEAFLSFVKEMLHTPVLRYADGGKPVHKVAVGGGACASELMDAINAGCDTFVTSDAKYNDFWDARDLGLTLIDAGHFYTENPICARLQSILQASFPEVRFLLSREHRDCMKFY